jgi:hypothetical protein
MKFIFLMCCIKKMLSETNYKTKSRHHYIVYQQYCYVFSNKASLLFSLFQGIFADLSLRKSSKELCMHRSAENVGKEPKSGLYWIHR